MATGSLGRRKSSRRNSWLPYEASHRLQRDALIGIAILLVSSLALVILGAMNDDLSVKFVDGLPQLSDGRPCQLLQVSLYDQPTMPMRAMVDCNDASSLGFNGVLQHLLIALSGVGVLLVLSAIFSLVLASRMPSETLGVPICVVGIIFAVIAVWWGMRGNGPILIFQGFRANPVAGILRQGGSVNMRDGAVSWGVGLLAASCMRLTRT